MNERIRELALQAGKYADETQPRGSYTRDGMWLYAYNEKFAELIVRECAELMKKESEGYSIVGSDYCDHKAEAFGEAVDLVKKHFGVK